MSKAVWKNGYEAMSETELIHATQAGDIEAAGELIKRYTRLIWRIAGELSANPEERGDVFQEMCIVVLKALPRWRDTGAPLSSYICTVATRAGISWLRKNRRARAEVGIDDILEMAGMLEEVDLAPSPEEALQRAADVEPVRNCLHKLRTQSPRLHEALMLWLLQRSGEEMGKVLGISRNAAQLLVHRAKKAIMSCLVQHWPDWVEERLPKTIGA